MMRFGPGAVTNPRLSTGDSNNAAIYDGCARMLRSTALVKSDEKARRPPGVTSASEST
jgi:hypothetical protein